MYLCVVDQHQPLVFNQPGRTNARDAVMFYLLLPLRTRTCMTSYPSRLNYILISQNFTVFGSSGLSNFCHYCERNLAVFCQRHSASPTLVYTFLLGLCFRNSSICEAFGHFLPQTPRRIGIFIFTFNAICSRHQDQKQTEPHSIFPPARAMRKSRACMIHGLSNLLALAGGIRASTQNLFPSVSWLLSNQNSRGCGCANSHRGITKNQPARAQLL